MLWIPHQLVGAPVGYNVTLECFAEAHPNSLNYWTREDGQMIHETKKHKVSTQPMELPYKTQMLLTIIGLRTSDFGTYKCVAKNPRGETDGTIRLYGKFGQNPSARTLNPLSNSSNLDPFESSKLFRASYRIAD
ncbi:hypothetical protein AAG570_008083 [Ranatra chinensis]|uniref:Ig-like domain-containing protein n=1 Tax=Ranatra chinensis TaxID=642074 RepID=A0ABD0YHL6_9HEMI